MKIDQDVAIHLGRLHRLSYDAQRFATIDQHDQDLVKYYVQGFMENEIENTLVQVHYEKQDNAINTAAYILQLDKTRVNHFINFESKEKTMIETPINEKTIESPVKEKTTTESPVKEKHTKDKHKKSKKSDKDKKSKKSEKDGKKTHKSAENKKHTLDESADVMDSSSPKKIRVDE